MGSTMQNIIFLWSGQPLKVAILITELFCNTSGTNLAGIPTKVLPNWSAIFNPLTPISDQDRISPYNINTISSRQVMRIEKNINYGIISWSNTKFSKLTSQELYGRQ